MRIREVIEIINQMQVDGIIALELGRTKDKLRLSQFIEEEALDMALFETILARHKLSNKWHLFKQQFGY